MPSARSSVMPSTRWRVAGVGILTVGTLGFTAVAAEAHVSAHADSTAAGSFSQITLRVPNESESAGTVKLEVQLPTDTPFPFVSAKPIPGWKISVVEAKLPKPVEEEGTTITKAARTVTWTAEKGTQVGPGEYQEFSISAGPLPDPKEITLPAVQTYSNGEVVEWNQPTPASGEEPEHPAPTIEVVAATGGDAHGAEASPSAAASTSTAPSPAASSAPADNAPAAASASGSDTTARALAGLALLVGIVAGAVGALGLRRAARR
jgi:periplasmic copper chaperone A